MRKEIGQSKVIYFDYQPKVLFKLPTEKIKLLYKLAKDAPIEGPSILKDLQNLAQKYPKSLYCSFIYYQTLCFFEYFDEADKILAKMKKNFLEQVFVKCIMAEALLEKKDYKKFSSLFKHIEVLKGAFSKRRDFYFEEALFFHNLWGRYFFENKDEFQAQKHKKMILLIMNTLNSYKAVAFSNNVIK